MLIASCGTCSCSLISSICARLAGSVTLGRLSSLSTAWWVFFQTFELIDSSRNERMWKCKLWCEPLLWLPFSTLINEINKVFIWAAHLGVKILVTRNTNPATGVWHNYRVVVLIKENFSSSWPCKHRSWWNTFYFHHESHMFFFIFTWEQRVTNVELIEDATETPHINSCIIRYAEDDLGCSIEARLDIGVDLLIFKATTTKIDNLDAWFINFP